MNPTNNDQQPVQPPATPGVPPTPPVQPQVSPTQPLPAQPPVSQTPFTPAVSKPGLSAKSIVIIVVAALLFLAGILTIFMLMMQKADNTSGSSSQQPSSSQGSASTSTPSDESTEDKTSDAEDAAKQVIRVAEAYAATHDDKYPNSLTELKSSGMLSSYKLATSELKSVPSSPKTVEYSVCEMNHPVFPVAVKAGYWDYSAKSVKYTYTYQSSEKYITTCTLITE
jgi:Tfp pilus assembly protein PilV